jgi:hypothetical protein
LEKELEREERYQREVAFYIHYLPANPPTLFFWGGGGGLGLPKFHVLSFWNWLEIRNQLGSWVLKTATTRKEEEHTHNHHNTKEKKGQKHTLISLGPIAQSYI